MDYLRFGIWICTTCFHAVYSQNTGFFWHITDMHWDPTYQTNEKALSCNPGTPGGSFGKYGDYRCDPPWELLNSSVYAMAQIKSDVDFLIWTGDDTPHIWNDTILNKQAVSDIVFNQTDLIQKVFPDKIVYSALGNHDWSPKNQVPPTPDPFYDDIADAWQLWLNETDELTFRKAAYYTKSENPNLRMVVMNTNLYYSSNELTEDMPDPGNQLQWFDDVMRKATSDNEKVIIVAHLPPGMFEKHQDKYWFYPSYNREFHRLLKKYSAIIGSIHMAHHHTDSFRIVYDDQGVPGCSMFLAPAVTPWETTLPDTMGGLGNNPAIRLVEYDRSTGQTLDIHQYWLNLTLANSIQEAVWSLEYNATQYFNVGDMSAASLHDMVESMKTNDELFSNYYKANGVLYDPNEKWTENFRTVHVCAITCLDYDDYATCMNPPDTGAGTVNKISALLSIFMFSIPAIFVHVYYNSDF